MKTHSNPPTAIPWEPTEDEIREHAYQLWLQNGQPEGRDLEHWFNARAALRHIPPVRATHRRPHVTLRGAPAGAPHLTVDATTPPQRHHTPPTLVAAP